MGGMTIASPGGSRGARRGSKRARRLRKRAFGLQLTSLMDVLIIIVIFLLKSYGLSSMAVVQADKLELPVSKATETFGEGIVLVVAQDKITVDEEAVLEFASKPEERKFQLPEGSFDTSNAGRGILPIYDVLKKKKDDFELLASRQPDPKEAAKKWTGDLLVQADKSVSYELIRQIMYTAGMAGYRQFRLTVEKQPE